jgi:hypothetical protein
MCAWACENCAPSNKNMGKTNHEYNGRRPKAANC